MKIFAIAVMTMVFLAVSPGAMAQVENYMNCSFNEGKTPADFYKWVDAYNKLRKEADYPEYKPEVLGMIYGGEQDEPFFLIRQTFSDLEAQGKSRDFYARPEVSAKLNPLFADVLTCKQTTVWMVYPRQ